MHVFIGIKGEDMNKRGGCKTLVTIDLLEFWIYNIISVISYIYLCIEKPNDWEIKALILNAYIKEKRIKK
jgi:hypothetical protein